MLFTGYRYAVRAVRSRTGMCEFEALGLVMWELYPGSVAWIDLDAVPENFPLLQSYSRGGFVAFMVSLARSLLAQSRYGIL